MEIQNSRIGIIGMGYVGLPLAVEFGKLYSVVGFDINQERIRELMAGFDRTLEVPKEEIVSLKNLKFSFDERDLESCNIFIVTVPTPVDRFKTPDFSHLINASELVGRSLKPGDIVIYESTVYPGATEEICVPILERTSKLKYNSDFYCGYSPERVNPGDKKHRIVDIVKVVSGSTPDVTYFIDQLYKSIIKAGTFVASSIKVAEAAKAIENAQRDINIAFVNELATLFHLMGLDTNEVLEAAATKWNFLHFKPGLVGGHCIGVDPYYLTYKARELGYHPEVILAGRRINDSMPKFIANEILELLIGCEKPISSSKVLILGFTFKENCPDVRNSKVWDLYQNLCSLKIAVDIFDPIADHEACRKEYGFTPLSEGELLVRIENNGKYDAIIIAVAHSEFLKFSDGSLRKWLNEPGFIYDVKALLPRECVDVRL